MIDFDFQRIDFALKTEVLSLIHAGELAQATERLKELTSDASEYPDLAGRAESLLGEVWAMRGDFQLASQSFRRAIQLLDSETSLHASLARARRAHAKALLVLASAESARVELTKARVLVQLVDDPTKQLLALLETEILAGLIALSARDLDAAETACRAAQDAFNQLDELTKSPEARRRVEDAGPHDSHALSQGMFFQLAGLVDLAQDSASARGLESLELAATHFRGHGLVYHHARAVEALGRATANSHVERAIDCVEQAHAMFTAMGAEFLATRAREWIDQARLVDRSLGGTPKPRRLIHRLEPTATEYCGIVIAGPATKRVVEAAIAAGYGSGAVLITGETGTGKELVAEAIHQSSARASRPMLAVNCAALSESLLETELFGHEKGSFSGATERRAGLFEEADGSTILLDEIGETTPQFQAKLLRVLQQGELMRVGGRKPIHVDVRVIAATNRDLEREIADGQFRQDLYYRLNATHITLVPLRERRREIVPLAARVVTRIGADLGVDRAWIKGDAGQALERCDWPGNVRQLVGFLRAMLERALHETGRPVITREYVEEGLSMLPGAVGEPGGADRHESLAERLARQLAAGGWAIEGDPVTFFGSIGEAAGRLPENLTWDDGKRFAARILLGLALAETNGNVTAAARRLDHSRSTLDSKIRNLGFVPQRAT